MHDLFCTFFPVSAVQKLLKSVKIWQSCGHMYTATFYEIQQKCRFWFSQVRCAHKSGDEINFIIVACRIYSWLKWYKNCKNRLRLTKVIVKIKMSRFLWFTVYLNSGRRNRPVSCRNLVWFRSVRSSSIFENYCLIRAPWKQDKLNFAYLLFLTVSWVSGPKILSFRMFSACPTLCVGQRQLGC